MVMFWAPSVALVTYSVVLDPAWLTMTAGGTDFVGGNQEIVPPGTTTTALSPSERMGSVRASVQLFTPLSSGTAHTVWSVALFPVYSVRQSVFGSVRTAPAVSQQPPVHAGAMEMQAARSTIGRRDRSTSTSNEPPADGKLHGSRSNLRLRNLFSPEAREAGFIPVMSTEGPFFVARREATAAPAFLAVKVEHCAPAGTESRALGSSSHVSMRRPSATSAIDTLWGVSGSHRDGSSVVTT